jgi:hypothetical protein
LAKPLGLTTTGKHQTVGNAVHDGDTVSTDPDGNILVRLLGVDVPATRDDGVLIMRKLIAWVFMYSLDGLLADEGTEYWQFCFGLPVDPADWSRRSAFTRARTRTSWGASPMRAWPEPYRRPTTRSPAS